VFAIMLQNFTMRQNAANAIEIAVALSFQRPQNLHIATAVAHHNSKP
jgi:hypothetical protein